MLLVSFIFSFFGTMNDRRPWTLQEDYYLKCAYQSKKSTKWSQIARALQDDYGVKGRNGKQCRERYITHIDTSHLKQEWNYPLEQRMLTLHNELGNKWAVIGHRMGGISDNSVKNHFYSLLRRALRKLNFVINREFPKEMKEFKPAILYRIVEVADEKNKETAPNQPQFSQTSQQLKNELLDFSFDQNIQETDEPDIDIEQAKVLIAKVNDFASQYKKRGRRSRKGSGQGQNLLNSRRFESKRLNAEQEDNDSSSNMHSEDLDKPENNDRYGSRIRFRKPSIKSVNEQMVAEEPLGMRTRARSQGSFAGKFIQKPNFCMSEDKIPAGEYLPRQNNRQILEGNISDHLEIQGILSGYQILQEGDSVPSVSMLRRQSSKISLSGEKPIDHQFHFFDDSGFQARGLPQMENCLRRESHMEENIFG